jgi:hypothetical protein
MRKARGVPRNPDGFIVKRNATRLNSAQSYFTPDWKPYAHASALVNGISGLSWKARVDLRGGDHSKTYVLTGLQQ